MRALSAGVRRLMKALAVESGEVLKKAWATKGARRMRAELM